MLYWLYTKLPFRLGKYVAMYACKYREPLHYHHDGCPSCYNYPYNTEFGDGRTEEEMERIDRRK